MVRLAEYCGAVVRTRRRCHGAHHISQLIGRASVVTRFRMQICNRRRNTPLHFAAEKTHLEVVISWTICNTMGNPPPRACMQVVFSILAYPGGMASISFENAIGKRPADLYVIVFSLPINIDDDAVQVLQCFSQGGFISGERDRGARGTASYAQQRLSEPKGRCTNELAPIFTCTAWTKIVHTKVDIVYEPSQMRATQKDGYIGKGHDWVTRSCRLVVGAFATIRFNSLLHLGMATLNRWNTASRPTWAACICQYVTLTHVQRPRRAPACL